jgi:aldehyde:ferredoxin oxidoreductase
MDKAVERTILTERAENASYGLRRKDDYFPKRFIEEPLPAKNGGFHPPIVIADFEEKLDYYYKYRGLDIDTGIPLESKLRELGMDKVAEDLEKVRGV